MPYPRKIGVLINGGCASSAEEFLLHARESKKVTLFGQATSGTLDYSNVRQVERCPSPCFSFYYPLTRSNRLPNYSIDKEKIKPTVYLTNDQDWVEVAVRQLKHKAAMAN
jgi:C-terminal processing protease CtpA/Prc